MSELSDSNSRPFRSVTVLTGDPWTLRKKLLYHHYPAGYRPPDVPARNQTVHSATFAAEIHANSPKSVTWPQPPLATTSGVRKGTRSGPRLRDPLVRNGTCGT